MTVTTTTTIDDMYVLWLSGLSIRKIGRQFNLGRMAVYGAFVRSYGKDCCNLRRQSLARVVYKEYGDLKLAMSARGTEGLYRTIKTEDNYSKIQSTGLGFSYHSDNGRTGERDLVQKYYGCEAYLSLSYYVYTSKLTTRLIYLTMMSRMNRMVPAD